MSTRHKLLLLDDDQDLLELYREILGRLPSKPEIHIATSGARAIALLESESFSLLISDLNMPKMDGLQVLTIVKRKFPHLRTAVMTSVVDPQFRTRAYAMGVDLFLEKPNTAQEISFFLDCIESLIGREEAATGFRGIQEKSLADIIQVECLSQSSAVLRIIQGNSEGKIWIQSGDIIDAAVLDLTGEQAFQRILSWKAGNFEVLPAEPARTRTIFNSYQGLLLESAQALDEIAGQEAAIAAAPEVSGSSAQAVSPLAELARSNGVEFVLTVSADEKQQFESWGLENPENIADWARQTMQSFRSLGESLNAGQVNQLEGLGPQRHVAIAASAGKKLCVGFHRSLSQTLVRETFKEILGKWVS